MRKQSDLAAILKALAPILRALLFGTAAIIAALKAPTALRALASAMIPMFQAEAEVRQSNDLPRPGASDAGHWGTVRNVPETAQPTHWVAPGERG